MFWRERREERGEERGGGGGEGRRGRRGSADQQARGSDGLARSEVGQTHTHTQTDAGDEMHRLIVGYSHMMDCIGNVVLC